MASGTASTAAAASPLIDGDAAPTAAYGLPLRADARDVGSLREAGVEGVDHLLELVVRHQCSPVEVVTGIRSRASAREQVLFTVPTEQPISSATSRSGRSK